MVAFDREEFLHASHQVVYVSMCVTYGLQLWLVAMLT